MFNFFKRKNTKTTFKFNCSNQNCNCQEAQLVKHLFLECVKCFTLQCLDCRKTHSIYVDCNGNTIVSCTQDLSLLNLVRKTECTCGLENCQSCKVQLQHIQNQMENARRDTLSDKFFKVLAKIFLPVVQ